jgi:hypothetical protein
MRKPVQLMLFGSTILYSDYLIAEKSPKKAFYKIKLIHDNNSFSVKKESGAKGKTLDTREWSFDDIELAEKFYSQKLRQKINPNRKKRIYRVMDS